LAPQIHCGLGDNAIYDIEKYQVNFGSSATCLSTSSGSRQLSTLHMPTKLPCLVGKQQLQTTYQQQRQYFITEQKDLTCPKKMIWLQLLQELTRWWAAGNQIILFMDHNEHTYNGPLGRAFADTSSLGLQEAVLQYTGARTGATFF
jgi:hypothetical protein